MHPPVKSEPRRLRVSFERLEIHVLVMKLPGIVLDNDIEMKTIKKVRIPSVNAP